MDVLGDGLERREVAGVKDTGPVAEQPSRAKTQPLHQISGAHKLAAPRPSRHVPHLPVGPFRCARLGSRPAPPVRRTATGVNGDGQVAGVFPCSRTPRSEALGRRAQLGTLPLPDHTAGKRGEEKSRGWVPTRRKRSDIARSLLTRTSEHARTPVRLKWRRGNRWHSCES